MKPFLSINYILLDINAFSDNVRGGGSLSISESLLNNNDSLP